jgi:hypothetical protein
MKMLMFVFLILISFISAIACDNNNHLITGTKESKLYRLSYSVVCNSIVNYPRIISKDILDVFFVLFEELSTDKLEYAELKSRFYFLSDSLNLITDSTKRQHNFNSLPEIVDNASVTLCKITFENRSEQYVYIENKSGNILLSAGFWGEIFGAFTQYYVLPNSVALQPTLQQ